VQKKAYFSAIFAGKLQRCSTDSFVVFWGNYWPILLKKSELEVN
jgi:hypothetical protein